MIRAALGEGGSVWSPASGFTEQWQGNHSQQVHRSLCHSPKAPGCPLQAKPHLQQDSQTSVACHRLLCSGSCFLSSKIQPSPIWFPVLCRCGPARQGFEWDGLYYTSISTCANISAEAQATGKLLEGTGEKNSLTCRLMPASPPLDSHSFNLNSEFSGVLCSGRGSVPATLPARWPHIHSNGSLQRQWSWPCLEHLSPGTEGTVAC